MKIKLNGCFGKQEILERLASVLNTMEDNGITEFRDIDIELTPPLERMRIDTFHQCTAHWHKVRQLKQAYYQNAMLQNGKFTIGALHERKWRQYESR